METNDHIINHRNPISTEKITLIYIVGNKYYAHREDKLPEQIPFKYREENMLVKMNNISVAIKILNWTNIIYEIL